MRKALVIFSESIHSSQLHCVSPAEPAPTLLTSKTYFQLQLSRRFHVYRKLQNYSNSLCLGKELATPRRSGKVRLTLAATQYRFLIVTGTAELFSAECDSLCYNLRKAGLPVEELNVPDEVQ